MRDGCHHDFIRDAAFADSLTNNRVVYFLRALAPALQEFVYVIFAPPDGYQGSQHLGTALLESTDISMLQCAASSFNSLYWTWSAPCCPPLCWLRPRWPIAWKCMAKRSGLPLFSNTQPTPMRTSHGRGSIFNRYVLAMLGHDAHLMSVLCLH